MSALSDLVKYAQVGDVIYKRGDHEHPYERANEAAAELTRLQAVEQAITETLPNVQEMADYYTERDYSNLADVKIVINVGNVKKLAAALAAQ
jgi:hypothetical protein